MAFKLNLHVFVSHVRTSVPLVNNISNEKHRYSVFDAPARMLFRFPNFLRDGARHHAPYCGKGQQKLYPVILKTFFEDISIGNRTQVLPLGLEPGRWIRILVTVV